MRLPRTFQLLRLPVILTLLLLGLYLYSVLMEDFGAFATEHIDQHWLEILLVCYLYALIYLSMRPGKFRPLIAALPMFLLYLLHDVFFLIYGKVFRIINFSEVPELLQIVPWFSAVALVLIFTVPLALIIYRFRFTRSGSFLIVYVPLLFLTAVLLVSPSSFVQAFESLANEIVKYSDAKSVENNGRLSMMLYREAQRQDALQTILPYRNREQYEQQVTTRIENLKKNINARNVHLIVLESFLDPRLFRKLSFSRSPVAPEFEALFNDKLGLSKSPVFGGATAQAEFELLCGVPAFERLSSVEFNMFGGSNVYCLPGLLSEVNYRTVATNAYKPNFFNAIDGYEGTGFDELHFPVEFYSATESYLQFGDPGDEEYMFDRELFEQNLSFIKKHLVQHPEQPLLNYVMTIYGHTPHNIDPDKRPAIITTQSDFEDDHLQRVTNQFYYRSEAIAEYVRALMAVDPDSLIVLVTDHVPPLRKGPNTYNALGYLPDHQDAMYYNRLAVIENRQVRRYHDIHHYELPDIVFNYLTQGEHCRKKPCAHLGQATAPREQRLDEYLQLMAHATD